MMNRQLGFLIIITGLLTLPYTVHSGTVKVDWRNSFVLQGNGFDTPLIRLGFNPQPEPPAIGDFPGAIGFDMTFTSMSDVTLKLQVIDAQTGTPIGFSAIPLPASVCLFVSGLTGLAGISRVWQKT